jgi:hypothetical protein
LFVQETPKHHGSKSIFYSKPNYRALFKLLFCRSATTTSYFRGKRGQFLVINDYQPQVKRGRGRPKGSGKVNPNGAKPKKRNAKPKKKFSREFLNVEHRKDFSVIILNSRRLVINTRKTDAACLQPCAKIKKLNYINNIGNQPDDQLFGPKPEFKTMTLNQERLVFINLSNNMATHSDMINFESAITHPDFKNEPPGRSDRVLEQLKVPVREIAFTDVYNTHTNQSVLNYHQAKNMTVRKESNVIFTLPIKESAKHVEGHQLLNKKPLHLTVQDVYEHMDFESFVHDIERVNENVTRINLSEERSGSSMLPIIHYQGSYQEQGGRGEEQEQEQVVYDSDIIFNEELLRLLHQCNPLELQQLTYANQVETTVELNSPVPSPSTSESSSSSSSEQDPPIGLENFTFTTPLFDQDNDHHNLDQNYSLF